MHVDFKQVKSAVSIEQVLAHYNVAMRKMNGTGLRGHCPIPNHQGKSDSFSANTEKNVFQCFSCGAKGNVLDLVQKMEGGTIKDSAERLADWFGLKDAPTERQNAEPKKAEQAEPKPVLVNIPLKDKWSKPGKPSDGRLKGLEFHPYVESRGFTKDLCDEHGIGYCAKGKMAGRVVFPICNPAGDVVAYCGRAVDDGLEPRWLQPEGFHKSLELYGIERAAGRSVVIVESFWGVLACARAELPIPAVALRGKTMSEEQSLLLDRFDEYTLLLDGNAKKEGSEIGKRLLDKQKTTRVVFLEESQQPDALSVEELQIMMGAF